MSAQREPAESYWAEPLAALLDRLASGADGLSSSAAAQRLASHGRNELARSRPFSALRVLASQFRSPLVLILVAAAALSSALQEWTDAGVVLAIVAMSSLLGFWREYGAGRALEKLRSRLELKATLVRDGTARSVAFAEIVPGDVAVLSAGSLVPGDGVLIEANDFFVGEAVLTGEPNAVEKRLGVADPAAQLGERTNCVFMGTSVRSGIARVLIVRTGRDTEYGAIAERLKLRAPESEFDRAMMRFGYLLTRVMLTMTLAVFALNVAFHRPVIESLLFSVALAVGLTPELLPAIVGVNLARSAQRMAGHGVLVRRLAAIENLGSMDILCTDKTGTLTEGVVALERTVDIEGATTADVHVWAARNARLQQGLANPLDQAILEHAPHDPAHVVKLGEIPYDFVRKRLSVAAEVDGRRYLVTKGAVESVLSVCTRVADGGRALDDALRGHVRAQLDEWSSQGLRTLAVALRELAPGAALQRDDERDLICLGFLLFSDPPKLGVRDALEDLHALGVQLKLISGDDRRVARHIATAVGLGGDKLVTGRELATMRDEALWQVAERTDIFAEVDPNQKERILLALKKTGHVVGYMGDGINDAPALHCADVSISVEGAADVAREAADFVLLERDVEVLGRGIRDGRMTFANTLKYVLTTESANLGNMVSMALASLFLPFLPLTATQVLLNNLLSDVPALSLARDSVDPELVLQPRRWNMAFVWRYMLEFGLLSSLFDFLTFAVVLRVFHSDARAFQSAWFVESLLTELAVALVIRTRRRFWKSAPARALWISSASVALVALALPYSPHADLLGFQPLPAALVLVLIAITALYSLATEALKGSFYRRVPS